MIRTTTIVQIVYLPVGEFFILTKKANETSLARSALDLYSLYHPVIFSKAWETHKKASYPLLLFLTISKVPFILIVLLALRAGGFAVSGFLDYPSKDTAFASTTPHYDLRNSANILLIPLFQVSLVHLLDTGF